MTWKKIIRRGYGISPALRWIYARHWKPPSFHSNNSKLNASHFIVSIVLYSMTREMTSPIFSLGEEDKGSPWNGMEDEPKFRCYEMASRTPTSSPLAYYLASPNCTFAYISTPETRSVKWRRASDWQQKSSTFILPTLSLKLNAILSSLIALELHVLSNFLIVKSYGTFLRKMVNFNLYMTFVILHHCSKWWVVNQYLSEHQFDGKSPIVFLYYNTKNAYSSLIKSRGNFIFSGSTKHSVRSWYIDMQHGILFFPQSGRNI